jgi:hypothetical protein
MARRWHGGGDARALNGPLPVEVDDDGDIIEPDPADPEACDSWEVILGGRTTLIG